MEMFAYRQSRPPEKREYDEYIRLYRENVDEAYFLAFLYYYEAPLNRRTRRFCERHYITHLCNDVKQTIVLTLFECAKKYETQQGVPFLAYTQSYVKEALRDYLCENGGVHSVPAAHFRYLSRINAMYYERTGAGSSSHDAVKDISQKTGLAEKKIYALIAEGEAFREFNDISEMFRDTSDENNIDEYERYDMGDKTADPGEIVPNEYYWDEVIDAVENLPYKQKEILLGSLGIRCMYCKRVGNRISYAELANRFELYSENAAEKQRKAAIDELKEVLPNPYSDE